MGIFRQNLNGYIFLIKGRFRRTKTGLNINRYNISENLSISESFEIGRKMCRL